MSNKSVCVDCKYFYGYDGVGELWVGCALHGDFKVKAVNCKSFEKKVTEADLLKKIRELEQENEQLRIQLNYIQDAITTSMQHQKAEIGKRALQKVIEEYNEYMLGHKKGNSYE